MRSAVAIVLLTLSGCNSAPPAPTQAQTVAPVDRPENAALNEHIALVLNLNGHLCARITSVVPIEVRANHSEVTCVEYRDGRGEVRYILDAANAKAFKA